MSADSAAMDVDAPAAAASTDVDVSDADADASASAPATDAETESGSSAADSESAAWCASASATPSLSSNASFGTSADLRREMTAFIFDWDDTLLPSSWLAANDLRLDSPDELDPKHREQLDVIEAHVIRVLGRALELGEVHVVTNAETGWIELSSEKFMPGVARLLPRLNILSARSKYEPLFPNNPAQWKIEAFRETLRDAFDWLAGVVSGEATAPAPGAAPSEDPIHVISLGDSYHERQALHVSTADLKNAHVKSIKFVERPEMDVLRRELELIHSVLDYVASHPGDLDLMLSQSLLFEKDAKVHDLLEGGAC